MWDSSRYKIIGWLFNLCFMGLVSGCVGMNANTLKPMPRGVVVDQETGKPISGAYVLVQYIGDSGAIRIADPGSLPSDECYGSLVAKTDEAGRFDFSLQGRKKPVSMKLPRNQRMEITAYKPGYTMERSRGYQSSLGREHVMVRYEPVSIGEVRLEMTPQERSKYDTRHHYLINIVSYGFCGEYRIDHWEMAHAMLNEAKQSAGTLSEWSDTYSLCGRINMHNEDQNLGRTILDCSVYAKKIEQKKQELTETFKKHAGNFKKLLRNLDWGDGPSLELMQYEPKFTRQNIIAFYMSDLNGKSLNIENFKNLMEKACQVGMPLEERVICFSDKNEPYIWRERAVARCYAYYDTPNRIIKILEGDYAGIKSYLEEGWCKK